MKLRQLYLLSGLSGFLFILGWPPHGFSPLLFLAFIPLLAAEDFLNSPERKFSGWHVFLCYFLAFFIWNSATTYWIWHASPFGAIAAFLISSLLQTGTFWIFTVVKRNLGPHLGYLFLIFGWIAFEFLNHRWELSWPWLTLGNGFAAYPSLVQWYEYTGTLGGSLWILLSNVILYRLFAVSRMGKKLFAPSYPGTKLSSPVKRNLLILAPLVILVPMFASEWIGKKWKQASEDPGGMDIVIVQPNMDPYEVKFDVPFQMQMQTFIELALQKVDSTTDYLVFPETAFQDGIHEEKLEQSTSLHILKQLIKKYPRLKVVAGASTYRFYGPGDSIPPTARKLGNSWYDSYNAGFQIDSTGKVALYHKSILVPGVEKLPYPEIFGELAALAVDLGGSTGTLGTQKDRGVFFDPVSGNGVAPIICYESIYGEYVGEYISNGANMLFIMTNDGWWRNTPGYKQHLLYGRLRAIEYRIPIARSANTGISCFINEHGDILQPTGWWIPAVIKGRLKPSTGETFYLDHGDYIGRASCILIPVFFILLLIASRRNRA